MASLAPSRLVLVAAVVCGLAGGAARAQEGAAAPSGCAGPEFRQLDFWLGEWDVEVAGNPDYGRGSSIITSAQGGCVVFENWSGMGLSGYSLNIYDRSRGAWHQTWTDSRGELHEYWGRLEAGAMVFTGDLPPQPPGTERRHTRMTLSSQGPDEVRQFAEVSSDGGRTWTTVYDLLYRRRPQPGASEAEIRALHVLVDRYVAGWLAGDPAMVMSVLTEDAVILPHDGVAPRVGREEIRRFWWPEAGPATKVVRFAKTLDEVAIEGDTAWARGRFDLAWTAAGSAETTENTGTFLMVFRRREGGWLVSRYMWDD